MKSAKEAAEAAKVEAAKTETPASS